MAEREITENKSTTEVTRPEVEGIAINLAPDEVEIALSAAQTVGDGAFGPSLWHRVGQRPGALVSVWSQSEEHRIVRLSVASATPFWNPRWGQFSFVVRRAPEALGADAASAQDRLEDEGQALRLLLLPGEQRSVTLEFACSQAPAGDYPFDVVLTDTKNGTTSSAPGLLRLRHPESGLMNFLPAIYAEVSRPSQSRFAPYEEPPFFGRFLRGFEDAMETGRAKLGQIDTLFDPTAAPADFLPWLATWVSLALDENWPELKRRRLIREAVELYRWRGTRRGLSRYLEIYTGIMPQIDDRPFDGMRLGQQTLLGTNTMLGGVGAHTFVVTLAVSDPKTVNEQTVRDIIESEKPAHAAYSLNIVDRSSGG